MLLRFTRQCTTDSKNFRYASDSRIKCNAQKATYASHHPFAAGLLRRACSWSSLLAGSSIRNEPPFLPRAASRRPVSGGQRRPTRVGPASRWWSGVFSSSFGCIRRIRRPPLECADDRAPFRAVLSVQLRVTSHGIGVRHKSASRRVDCETVHTFFVPGLAFIIGSTGKCRPTW